MKIDLECSKCQEKLEISWMQFDRTWGGIVISVDPCSCQQPKAAAVEKTAVSVTCLDDFFENELVTIDYHKKNGERRILKGVIINERGADPDHILVKLVEADGGFNADDDDANYRLLLRERVSHVHVISEDRIYEVG